MTNVFAFADTTPAAAAASTYYYSTEVGTS